MGARTMPRGERTVSWRRSVTELSRCCALCLVLSPSCCSRGSGSVARCKGQKGSVVVGEGGTELSDSV